MSFNTALSGLQSATVDLSVTSNNIANVATTGFKGSRAEFAALFEISPFGNTPSAVGSGVKVASVSQQFDQGNLKFTEAALDMAISGQGFFVTNKTLAGQDITYTRLVEANSNKLPDGRLVGRSFQVHSGFGRCSGTFFMVAPFAAGYAILPFGIASV